MTPQFTVDFKRFGSLITDFQKASGMSLLEAVKYQGMLYGRELMDRTPPFSGRAIVRMLGGRTDGAILRDVEITNMNARQVGIRRVEKDIRRVIYGVNKAIDGETVNDSAPRKDIKRKLRGMRLNKFIKGLPAQMCQGKVAVRIFATKGGEVFGTDVASVMPQATMDDLEKHHTMSRGKRGRVTTAGSRTINVGRWRWLNTLVTKEATVKRYVRQKQRAVGSAKAGWGAGYVACGGKLGSGGWIGRHMLWAGSETHNWELARPWITFVNRSKWASAGDPDRVMQQALLGRAKAMEGDIRKRLDGTWQKAKANNKMNAAMAAFAK